MKLYLFGGAETDRDEGPVLKSLIKNVLVKINPKQLLHIPYARNQVPEGDELVWGEGWIQRDLNLRGVELLDARNENDLIRADKPVVFINGGPWHDLLFEKITANKLLYNLVIQAEYLIGESAGAMVTGEFKPTYRNHKWVTVRGLGIIKNTIIEVHYSQRDRQKALRKEIKESGVKYGIGIDTITGIVLNTKTYPEKYSVLGNGLVEFIKKID